MHNGIDKRSRISDLGPVLGVFESPNSTKRCIDYTSDNNNNISSGLSYNRNDSDSNRSYIIPLKGPAGRCDINSNSLSEHDHVCWNNNTNEFIFDSWINAMNSLTSNVVDLSKYPDYSKNIPFSSYITKKFNIRKILQNKHSRIFMVDYLITMVNSTININPDLILVLSDKTGQMLGCLYKEDITSYRNHIVSGCTLVLSNIIVYVPIGNNPYLIITNRNIIQIFQNNIDNKI